MSKKVLILSSSPRRNGNSDLLCNEFMRGAAEAGHQVEKIFLKDKHINYCTGCSVCSMYGKPCPQKDDATGKRSEKAESPANDKKKGKPSREERGYTKARGKKDDWKQFFQGNNDFKDAEPDFSEEGWARRTPKKK